MTDHKIVSREEWNTARQQFLAKEKEFTRLRDELSRERRELPWERVDKHYAFDTSAGRESLSDLFAGRQQLIVYHFMFAPDWEVGCKSCSFWADNFNGITDHLNARDVSLVAISRAPLKTLQAFQQRLGWSFKWVSSVDNDFNFAYRVSFTPDEVAQGEAIYNYAKRRIASSDLPGISVFLKDEHGDIFHTYSCYARGLDMFNTAYHLLDIAPKGRDEADLPFSMAWVKFRDQYGS